MSDEGTNSVRSAVRLPTRTSVYIETKDGVFDVMPENTSVEKLLFSSKRDLEKNNKIAFTSTVSSAVMVPARMFQCTLWDGLCDDMEQGIHAIRQPSLKSIP